MKSGKLCCLSLETGALVVAGVQMFFCTVSLIIGAISMNHEDYLVDNLMAAYNFTSDYDPNEIREFLTTCKLENN